MKKTRTEKGITLIALIITIVTLLILASVAISSIQNDGILSYTENVANKYNQSQRDEQSVFDQYLGYLKGDNEWITIYEGQGVTEEGELLLANKHLFKDGNFYRITVESDEFSGVIETVAVLAMVDTSYEYYILFGVHEGEVVTATSLAEYMTILNNIGENAQVTSVFAANITGEDGQISGMEFDDSTCEYTILKIEEKEGEPKDPSVIFEGELAAAGSFAIPTAYPLTITRKYQFDLTINGEKVTLFNEVTPYLSDSNVFILLRQDEENIMLISGIGALTLKECTINAIYDVGPTDAYVAESEYEAVYDRFTEQWFLFKTPNTNYILPETVAGKPITGVYIDTISGSVTFDRPVTIISLGEPINVNIKVTTSDLDFIFNNDYFPGFCGGYLDLTQCGDNIEFPEEFLSTYQHWTSAPIYVSAAVKANYEAYDFIQVKQ